MINTLEFQPKVDLFGSHINNKLDSFFAYRPDPEVEVIDAFSVKWDDIEFYAFPPFNCVSRVLQKVVKGKATGIIVVPDWPSQIWYHMLNDLTIASLHLPPRSKMFYLPNNKDALQPLRKNLTLRASLISGCL